MVGICFASLALLAGMLGIFGLSWYRGKQKEQEKRNLIYIKNNKLMS
jgi:hypothetical protein